MALWDTCENEWTLGLFCRHGHHHVDCEFYTKSQNHKERFVREVIEDKKSNERLHTEEHR